MISNVIYLINRKLSDVLCLLIYFTSYYNKVVYEEINIVYQSVKDSIQLCCKWYKKTDLNKSAFLWNNSKGQVNSFPNWFGCFGYLMEPVMLRLTTHYKQTSMIKKDFIF